MNAENFSRYLQDRALLHQLPYEELKTMALQYPYCQPLQLLLLRKSLQDNRKDWEAALARVAATSSDRSLLYAEVSAFIEDTSEEEVFHLSEDYLELHSMEEDVEDFELSSLESAPEPSVPALELDFTPEASVTGEADHSPEGETPSAGVTERLDLSFAEEAGKLEAEIEAWKSQELEALESALNESAVAGSHEAHTHSMGATADGAVLPGEDSDPISHAVHTAVTIAALNWDAPEDSSGDDRMAPHGPLHKPRPSPRPKSSFTSWVAQFQPPDIQTQLNDIMESGKMEEKRRHRKKKKQKPSSKVDEIVLQSITENGNLVSETLAKVLVQQGQYEKAEEMYRRLMLVFPEKSDYFAQQILNIKSN